MRDRDYDTEVRVFRDEKDDRKFAPDGSPIVAPFELLCLWYDVPDFCSRGWLISKELIPQRHETVAAILAKAEGMFKDKMPDRILAYQVTTYD